MVFWQPPLPPPPPPPPAFVISDLATHPFFLTLACMLVLDVAVCRHTLARWFLLHAWGNIIVTVFALPDALRGADNPGTSCIGGASTYVPLWQIIVLHLYHLVFFACSTADWVHHCVFVSIIGGCGLYFEGGPLVNLVAFFMCGIPGALDYVMLSLVKHGHLAPLVEKAWNARINVWIRSPGMLLCTFCAYQATRHGPESEATRHPLIALLVSIIIIVNAQYYMQRVTGNAYRKSQTFSS